MKIDVDRLCKAYRDTLSRVSDDRGVGGHPWSVCDEVIRNNTRVSVRALLRELVRQIKVLPDGERHKATTLYLLSEDLLLAAADPKPDLREAAREALRLLDAMADSQGQAEPVSENLRRALED